MDRHNLDTATTWLYSVLESIGRNYPKVSFSLKAGGDCVYELIVEGSQRRTTVKLGESFLNGIADGNEAIRSQVAENMTGLARHAEWKLEHDEPKEDG